ncbi:MAG: VCBS domain-containing protein, partial [Comamonas sp.]
PATQALNNGQTISVSMDYTLTDKDGDTRGSNVTFGINGANDSATVTPNPGGGGSGNGGNDDGKVYEHGLVSGDGSKTTTGSVTVSATDGIKDVSIGGTTHTVGDWVGKSVTTADGSTLTVTSVTPHADGSVTLNYNYTLNGAQTNDQAGNNTSVTDTIGVTVTGQGGSSANGSIVITIVDDTPVAHSINAGTLTEDGASTELSGTVAPTAGNSNSYGADGAAATAPTAWGNVTATLGGNAVNLSDYGTLTQNANGSWTFVLDNSKPATQALNNGQTISVSMDYTLTDKDGDTRGSNVTFGINGANDSATVTPNPGGGGSGNGGNDDGKVYEHGLVSGDGSKTTTGSVTVSATDGIKDVSIGGTTHTVGDWVGKSVTTADGSTLTVTSVTPHADGSVTLNYNYTLNGAQTNDQAGNNTSVTDTIGVTVTGQGGSSANGSIVITIVDDTPVAHSINAGTLTEDGASTELSGTVAPTAGNSNSYGADGAAATAPTAWGNVTATLGGNAVNLSDYGTLTQNANGSWTFVLDNSKPATQALNNGQTISVSMDYTLTDKDGDTRGSNVTFGINGANDSATVTPNPGGGGSGNGG